MKSSILPSIRFSALIALTLAAVLPATLYAQASWNGGGGDGLWNTALNWDIGVPADGTNATIGAANTVTYDVPMAAGSFGALTLNGVLNVNATGFVLGAAGNTAVTVGGATARIFVNNGGVLSATNAGGITFTTAGGGSLAAGGSVTLTGGLRMGASGAGNTGFMTNNGGILSATSTILNPNNISSSCNLIINGGTNDLGAVSILRSSSGGAGYNAIGTEGLVISNGIVRMTSLSVGTPAANSALSMVVAGGISTNTGAFIVQEVTSGRGARFLQLGGLFVTTEPNIIRVGVTNAGQADTFSVIGGTNIAPGFILGDITNNSGTVNFTNAARIYLGSGGLSSNTISTLNVALNTGGTFGAYADWASAVSIILAGGAFECAGPDGTSHNITLNNVLRGSGTLNKNGPGILTLNVAETYTGNTFVNQGTLALGAAGSISTSPIITVGSGATLDVSAVSGFTVAATRTLSGLGVITGDVAVASSGIINPGSTTGTLSLSNALTVTGGAVLHFDLPAAPGPGNDSLVVGGNLNASGANTIEVVGGGSPGTVHTLINYGGTFNGTLGNLNISGTSGILSNNATTKTISLIVQSAIRSPTNVVWVGNTSINDWDTVNRTNWQNAGTSLLDYFVTGDNALFNDVGATHPNVNLVGNNAPATLTVDSTLNYTFGGAGSISGTGSLLKTNAGTLTITNLNTFSGGVTIGGGVLEARILDIGGSPSSIGSAGVDPTKLVLDGGTLRYTGTNVSIDRPATLGAAGGTLDVPTLGTNLTISGAISGAGLTKAGAGQLTLTSVNTYTNGTVINAGTLQFNNNASGGTGGITNNGAAMLIQGALVLDNLVDFQGNCALEFNGVGGNNTALRGAWVGNGTVNVYFLTSNTNQTFTMGGSGAGGGHQWDFAGTVDFGTNTGFLRINNDNSNFNFGSSNATFNVGTGNASLNQRNGGTTTHLGALIGGPNTKLSGRGNTGASGTTTYFIGGNNIDSTFQGEINNGGGTTAISKVGTGKLTLTGASIHGGNSTVESGALQLDGSFSASPVTVNGGFLTGNGSITAGVTVNPFATLSPGNSIGQMTIGNLLVLASSSTNIMELNKAAGANDSIVGLAGVSYGGTLIVSNLAGTLTGGDTFKLFDSASYSGTYEAMVLPALSYPYFWNTNSLLVDGTLRVGGPSITNITVSGTSLTLDGSGGPALATYVVLTSTDVTLPRSSWTRVVTNQFDANGDFSYSATINPATPQKFYTFVLP